ncbi:MAG: MATE family efflux transporter [Opitutaceae bacterium]
MRTPAGETTDDETGKPAPVAESFPFWRSVWQALKGEDHDYTALTLKRAVLLLAVPMVLEMVMESLFAVVDIFWVGRLGPEAIAVVGLTESIMTLVYAVGMGTAIAGTAIVARRIGEKDPAGASRAAGQVLLLGVGMSAALGLVLGLLAPQILRLMGAEETVVVLGADFARIMLGGNITVFLIFLINAVFRGAGDAAIAMRTLWLANALNIVLDPCFIYGWGPFPEMGVTGAAVATNIGRGVGVCYQVWHLTGRPGRVRLHWKDLRPDWMLMGTTLKTAGPGIAQWMIGTTSWLGLFKILAGFGSGALAGYTISIRIMMFVWMPAWGLSNAGATLVGQNLGAGRPERAEHSVMIAMKYNTLFLSVVGLLFVIFARPLASVFTSNPEVLGHATRALWIVSLGFPIFAAGMCLEGAFNGAGDTKTPTRLNFYCLWLGQVPAAWLLAQPLGLGPDGVFIAVPVAFAALALWSWFLFKRGKWKLQEI